MLRAVWEWIKGLFGGKGTTQLGCGNKSVANVTIGNDAGGVVLGDGNQIHIYPQPAAPEPKPVELVPSDAEVEILIRLADSQAGYLNAVPVNGGYEVVIDGQQLGGLAGSKSAVQLF